MSKVGEIDALMRDLDTRWGVGQIKHLIPAELAERLSRQIDKWQTAVASGDAEQIETHAAAMKRAADAVEAAARGAGHVPRAEQAPDDRADLMVCRLKSGDVIYIVRDHEDAQRIAKDGGIAFTADELALCAEAAPGWSILMEAKRAFGAATVKRAERPKGDDWYERGGDDIPF